MTSLGPIFKDVLKPIFVAPFVSSGEVLADGAIIGAEVQTDGWSIKLTLKNWAGEQGNIVYDFGSIDTTNGNCFIDVVSEGYSSGVLGTISRVAKLTSAVRKPYPNDADLDEVDSGDDIVVRFAMSYEVYDDDKNGGAGTSGTDPTVTSAEGWAELSGVDAPAQVAVSCTNSSTLDYPKVIGQWDWQLLRGGWRRMESDFTMGFRARHGFGIDQVTLSCIGAVSSEDQNSNVTALTSTQNTVTSLYHESYTFGISIDEYTQAEQMDLRAIAYPLVGDADSILDTNTTTSRNNSIQGLGTCYVMCDKTEGMKVFASVDADVTPGSGATSSSLATARTTPYATVGAAKEDGANMIVVVDAVATTDILGKTPTATALGYYAEVTEDPLDAGVVLNRSGTWKSYNTDFLCYTDIGIAYSSGAGWLDGDTDDQQLLFDGVAFNTSAKPTVGLAYRSLGCWLINCTGIGTDDYEESSSARLGWSMTGCTITSTYLSKNFYTNIANKSTFNGQVKFGEKGTGNVAPTYSNVMHEFNAFYFLNQNGQTNTCLFMGENEDINGITIIGNIIEFSTSTASGPALFLGGDGSETEVCNVIMSHNSIVGQRCNVFYNDTGTVAVIRSQIFMTCNNFRSFNIKSDTFASSPNGNRMGDWAQLWATNWHDNTFDGSASSSFQGEFDGIRTSYILPINAYGELVYTNEESSDLGGAGNGDYTPGVSTLIRQFPAGESYITRDQLNVALADDGTDFTGALQ